MAFVPAHELAPEESGVELCIRRERRVPASDFHPYSLSFEARTTSQQVYSSSRRGAKLKLIMRDATTLRHVSS